MTRKEQNIIFDLSQGDIIDSIKMLVSFAKTLSILQEGDAIDENA